MSFVRGNLETLLGKKGLYFYTVEDILQARLGETYSGRPGRLCDGAFTAASAVVISDDMETCKFIPDMSRYLSGSKGVIIDGQLRVPYNSVPGTPIACDSKTKDKRIRDLDMISLRHRMQEAIIPDKDLPAGYFWGVHAPYGPDEVNYDEVRPMTIKARRYVPNKQILENNDLEATAGTHGYAFLLKVGPVAEGSEITSEWVTNSGEFISVPQGRPSSAPAFGRVDCSLLGSLASAAQDCLSDDGKVRARGFDKWRHLVGPVGNGDMRQIMAGVQAYQNIMAAATSIVYDPSLGDERVRVLMKQLLGKT